VKKVAAGGRVRTASARAATDLAPLIPSVRRNAVLTGCGGGGGSVPGALTVAPASLQFTSIGSTLTVTATESGYSGSFASSNSCAGIATITPANASGPTATFTVMSVATGGCSISVTDGNGQQAAVTISVTSSSATIQ